MAEIIFTCGAAAVAFASMAEGMQEVDEDCGEDERAEALGRIAQAVGDYLPDPPGPCTVPIDDADADAAQSVLENCLEATDGLTRDEADEDEQENGLFADEATIEV